MISEATINFFVGLILGATIMHYGIKTGKKLGCDPMNKIKIMLSSPMAGKTKEEINNERDKMADLLFDYYDDNCVIEATVIKNHEEKSALECFSESIFFMSQVDVLAMGFGWENARGCKLEHQIAKAYGLSVVYLDDIKKKLEE